MANTNLSANMSLPIPVVSQDPGPDWATHINACLTLVDGHDHSPGYGTPVTPSGLSINADLTMGSNNLTFVRSVRMNSQSAAIAGASDLNCIYDVLGDLYFNDGSGNQVRITQSGGVAGSPGSISTLTSPASASYNAGSTTFVWQAGANKAATMDHGALIIRETNVTSANGITIQSPTSLGAGYTITLPSSAPGSTQYLSMNSSGVIANVAADVIGSAMTSTGANAIFNARTMTISSTAAPLGGMLLTASSGSFTTNSLTEVTVTNLTGTIVTGGRPVRVGLQSDGSLSGYITLATGTGPMTAELRIYRTAALVGRFSWSASATPLQIPCSVINFDDTSTNGSPSTYVYTIKILLNSGTGTPLIGVINSKLYAYEI